MEPNILLIGRNLDTLEILQNELEKFDRRIVYANSEQQIISNLKMENVDLIVVGAGLPNEIKDELVSVIAKTAPKIELHLMERLPGITPASMISYTNEKAVMWRLKNVRNLDNKKK